MRKLMVALVAAALVGGAAWTALADAGGGTTPVNCMDTVWRTTAVSTSSTTFTTVPGLTDVYLEELDVTDAGLAHVAAVPGLARLSIDGCTKLTDAGLGHLKAARGLRRLEYLSGGIGR